MRIRNWLIATAVLGVALAACDRKSQRSDTTPRSGVSSGPVSSGTLMEDTRGDSARGAEAVNRFSHTLLNQAEDGNVAVSPTSISTVMAMAYAGSGGETARELADVMRFEAASPADLGALQAELRTRDGQERVELNLVNDTWLQEGYPVAENYIEFLRKSFDSKLRTTDFASNPSAAREKINEYISSQTRKRIPELIPRSLIDTSTRTVLTNAVYLKAAWQFRFSEHATKSDTFHAPDGDVQVPMMRNQANYRTLSRQKYDAVELPYAGGSLAALVVLPDEGKLAAVQEDMTADEFQRTTENLEPGHVDLSLPKFKVRTNMLLVEKFQKMGARAPFQPGADFDAIHPKLFIGEVVHEAYIDVHEKGTEAAAATAAVIQEESAPINTSRFVVDRPFLFYVYDKPTGAVLFATRVVDPTR